MIFSLQRKRGQMMNDIMLPTEFMKIGFTMAVPLIILYIVISFVENQVVKCTLYFLKSLAYFGLAWFMWKYYNGKEQMDIISAFTFIFCCFESADNLISLLSVPIEYIRKTRKDKFEYEMKKAELESRYKK